MTVQPEDPGTEQQFLGNEPWTVTEATRITRQAYLPNGHRLPLLQAVIQDDIEAARREQARAELAEAAAEISSGLAAAAHEAREPDLWLDAEDQASRALREIADGNVNAGIACLQAALAFALNYRHSLTEEPTR